MKINKHYTIFTGVLQMRQSSINKKELENHFQPWENRIFDGNYQPTLNHLKNNYYDSFLLGMLPDLLESTTNNNPDLLRRYTIRKVQDSSFSVSIKDQVVPLKCEYFDLYIFPNGLALFFYKLSFVELPSIDDVSDFTYKLRKLSAPIIIDGKEGSLKKWLETQLIPSIKLEKNWDAYIPQLKTYTILDLDEDLSIEKQNALLYDLGTVSPIGTSEGNDVNAPSEKYFQDLMEKHKISVFKNWSALSLFDTFTMVSYKKEDPYRLWEYDYFNVYMMAVYMKGFIYLANTTLSDVTVANRRSELVKNTFIEFINDYFISNISYRFLPNVLNEKIIAGLDIQVEIEKMEKKIDRLNETLKRNRDNRLNITILVLAIFSIFSVITDFSDWLSISMESKNWLYPYGGILALIVLVAILFVTINYSKFKKND